MRRAFSLLALSLSAFVVAAAAAWDDELAPQFEAGFSTRAAVRGLEQAREGSFASLRVEGESFRADVSWHQSFRRGDEHLGTLGFGYDVWKGSESSALALLVTHRRFGEAEGRGRGVEHTTEVGVRLTATPVGAFVPSLAYFRDLRRDADIVEGRVSREFALTRWGAFLNTSFFAGWIDASDVVPGRNAPSVSDGYAYWGADARLPYRVGERTMIVLAAHVSAADGASGAWSPRPHASRTRAGLSLSLTYDF